MGPVGTPKVPRVFNHHLCHQHEWLALLLLQAPSVPLLQQNHARNWIKLHYPMDLLIKDSSFLMSIHICLHRQHPSIQNTNCINAQRNKQDNRLHIVQIVMYTYVSNVTRYSILFGTCNVWNMTILFAKLRGIHTDENPGWSVLGYPWCSSCESTLMINKSVV